MDTKHVLKKFVSGLLTPNSSLRALSPMRLHHAVKVIPTPALVPLLLVVTPVLDRPPCAQEPVYESTTYTVFSDSITDQLYGPPAASTPDGHILSHPTRYIIKEQGAPKTSIIDTAYDYVPKPEIENYPQLITRHAIIDAVYDMALDILYRCSSGEFVRAPDKGEEPGMWQAGFRNGEGYGVWNRDVCYTGLMCGTLFDPEVARKSLHYCLANNSGTKEMDARALFPIAVYDYLCATGDRSLMEEHWDTLKVILRKTPVDSDKDFIVRAGNNSFVDNQFNCETGGYSLSCNVLYSGAYKAMAAMGALMNEPADTIAAWNDLGAKIAEGINRQHWRADAGYYTPGPIGSDGYEESFWENLGQSLAVWPRFGIADKTRRLSVLDNKDIAFNEWGFAEREYNDRYFTREDICFTMGHDAKWATHGRSVWLFTEVGEVVAMGAEGRMSELEQVFFAGLRDGAFNKTFHECVHWDTGLAWRYGGQLWNAVAYVAMIVQGMLGMEYDESGITFAHRCIPEAFADMRITNLKYRGAVLTIQVNGWGTEGSVLLDGAPATTIPADLAGEHAVTLDMGEAPATGSHVPAQTSPDPRPAGLRVHAAVGDVVVRNAGGTTLTCRLVDVTGRVVAARQLREGQLLRVPERRVGSGMMLLVSESEDGVHISRLFVGKAPGS